MDNVGRFFSFLRFYRMGTKLALDSKKLLCHLILLILTIVPKSHFDFGIFSTAFVMGKGYIRKNDLLPWGLNISDEERIQCNIVRVQPELKEDSQCDFQYVAEDLDETVETLEWVVLGSYVVNSNALRHNPPD